MLTLIGDRWLPSPHCHGTPESETATHDKEEAIEVAAVLAARHWKLLEGSTCNVDDDPNIGTGPTLNEAAVVAIVSAPATQPWPWYCTRAATAAA